MHHPANVPGVVQTYVFIEPRGLTAYVLNRLMPHEST